ncbi:hypothetical protein EJ02DRAFT_499285 [Clathrospora elynae]|uniref:Amine oxidase domain-containing protein n=1 Tax=Clathrospora elynae TaxID=706981 RepID=A0A6A5TF37_9PLEO|nr:hypothetical protein EJ02DRAFT_499285 [Clathrospora elynae]
MAVTSTFLPNMNNVFYKRGAHTSEAPAPNLTKIAIFQLQLPQQPRKKELQEQRIRLFVYSSSSNRNFRASGTHAAISLRDKGKTIIVIEKKARLGGHTETYTDPSTNTAQDYGVAIYHNISAVRDYFGRFGVPLVAQNENGSTSVNFDFRTGKPVNITSPSPEAVGAAMGKYAAFLSQYPQLNDGMFLPSPVPEDLTMPFGEFVTKYGIEALVQTMFTTNQGAGDILSVPMVENARVSGLDLIEQLASSSFLTTARHNNSELYGKAQGELLEAESLLLSSEVVHSVRTDDHGVKLIVQTPTGAKLILAQKLLITIPPRLEFLGPFALRDSERDVFAKLVDVGYYATLITDTGIPDELLLLQAANPTRFQKTLPKIVVYTSHAPFYLQATPQDIKAGIYAKMYALQGLGSTYWSGATFRAQDSSMIWRYNEEVVLPMVLKGL